MVDSFVPDSKIIFTLKYLKWKNRVCRKFWISGIFNIRCLKQKTYWKIKQDQKIRYTLNFPPKYHFVWKKDRVQVPTKWQTVMIFQTETPKGISIVHTYKLIDKYCTYVQTYRFLRCCWWIEQGWLSRQSTDRYRIILLKDPNILAASLSISTVCPKTPKSADEVWVMSYEVWGLLGVFVHAQ